jgi:acyl homoserine lactone synthase
MHISILKFPEDVERWDLVTKFLRFRKDVFIDEMGWPLYHLDAMEFEQYDGWSTVYIIAHEAGQVRGGARLLRTDTRFGSGKYVYSYMIRDAWRSYLDGLPTDLCRSEPPVDPAIWELTRLTVGHNPGLARDILNAANDFLRTQDATTCLFLGPPAFMRMAKSMGYAPEPLGAVTGNKDGRFLAFQCAVIDRETAVPPVPAHSRREPGERRVVQ